MWYNKLRVRTAPWNEDKTIWNWYYKINEKMGGHNYIIYISWSERTSEWVSCIKNYKKDVYINEKDLDIIKTKSLIKAKELGWNIKNINYVRQQNI